MSRAFRYNLILGLVALGTSLAAVAGWRFAKASAPVNGPIVLVTVDSLRADRLHTYGSSRITTPALDALAADGVVFERAFAHVPQTLPAHASLLSGRLPPATGVRDNVGFSIPESLRLVSTMLADRGYATGGVVSSFALRRETGLSRGFAFFDDELTPADASTPDAGPTVERDGAESEKRAERWLSGAGTSRAFLFLHLNEPHAPYAPPAANRPVDGPGRDAAYDGEVAYTDELVGRLITYLKKQQLYDESTIIVVGDHGEGLGAHGEQQHGLLLFDDTIRVPLIIKQAGSVGGGRRVSELVQHVDIVPTILDLAKAPTPGGLPGRSLRPLLEGTDTLGPRIAYAESLFPALQYGWPAAHTVTDGRFRYVTGPTPALFDLEADPESHTDVSAAHPEALTRLARALDEFMNATEAPGAVPLALSQVEREPMLALGYLGPRAFAASLGAEQTAVPDDAAAFVDTYRAAMTEVSRRRWLPAIERLRMLARAHADRPDAWAALGAVAEQAERPEVAAEAYRRVLAMVPEAVDLRARLADTLLRARRLDESQDEAELIAQSDAIPAQARGLALLARIAAARHDPAAARIQAQRLTDLDPTSPVPSYVEGRLLVDRGHLEAALAALDRAAELAQETPVADLHLLRGETLVKLDRQAEGEDAFLTELRQFPASSRAHVALATLYQGQGRLQEVVRTMSRLTALRTAESFELAARSWTSFGDRARADAARAEAERLFSPAAAAHLTQQ